MEPTAELKQAVRRYREGDTEAFTRLYEESSKYIYTCIYNAMRGNDNVEDAVCDIMQDTYVEISRNITKLENEDSFLSWAAKTAVRKCYAWLKKNKKYVLLPEEDDTLENLAEDDNIIPESVMQDREKQRLVREIIETRLTEMQKLCIIAYYYNEQKQSEIAQELGIPENTVKTNLSRAKARIKTDVLELEEKEGTRLYSVAPFLLLLFNEDVLACTVPATVTAAVNNSVTAAISAAGGAGTKTLMARIAAASAKAKITAGIIGIGAAGIVAGSVYMAAQPEEEAAIEESVENTQETVTVPDVEVQQEPETVQSSEEKMDILMRLNGDSWEEYYARGLLSPETKYLRFDLHDFDEDGIPELITEVKGGVLSIESFRDSIYIPFYISPDSIGYGEKASELISIYSETTEDGIDRSSVYAFDNFEMVELITIPRIEFMDVHNFVVGKSEEDYEEVSYEEGLQRIQFWKEKYRKVEFKPLDQDTVISVIEAHSENWRLDD